MYNVLAQYAELTFAAYIRWYWLVYRQWKAMHLNLGMHATCNTERSIIKLAERKRARAPAKGTATSRRNSNVAGECARDVRSMTNIVKLLIV